MAVNVSVFDLDNFPNNSKTVTVDLTELVPAGNSGEDAWVFSAITSATASGGAAIQRLYIKDAKWGWAKSSGLKSGPYSVTSSQRHLTVAIDEDIGSGSEIALDYNDVLTLGGDVVAEDMQNKISALAATGGAKAGNLSYLNVTVEFSNGRFKIVSGTASKNYTGSTRSSVAISDGTTTTGLAAALGFDVPFTSEDIAGTQVKQTALASGYTAEATSLSVTTAGIVANGDAIALSDGTNTEFRSVESSIGVVVTLSSGFTNSYSADSLVQVATLRDPDGDPPAAFTTVDEFIKFSIASIVNQIDFS